MSARAMLQLATLIAAVAPLHAFAAPADEPAGTRITILHTNDLHGHVRGGAEPWGLARIASLVNAVRRQEPNVLLLDAGDIIHGTAIERQFRGRPMIACMNAMGYSAATLGNHEFDMGEQPLEAAIAEARFPFLSANVANRATGQLLPGVSPYVVKEVAGVRIGIFGVTTLETLKYEWPHTIAGIRFTDPTKAARTAVRALREEQKAQVVIGLTHLGVEEDKKLAAAVPGIDLILGGHSHTRLPKQVWVKHTLIAQADHYAHQLGRVDLVVATGADGTPRVSINGQGDRWWANTGAPAMTVSSDTPEDPAVVAAYQPFEQQFQPQLDEKLTDTLAPLPRPDGRHTSALNDLLAEAIRAQAGVQAALSPSDAFDRGLDAGPIHGRDLYAAIGAYTRQHIVVVRAPGGTLRKALAPYAKPDVHTLATAGLKRDGDTLSLDGAPLSDHAEYTVAAAAYVIQDRLLGNPGVTVLNDDPLAPTVRDALIALLRGHAPLQVAP